MKSKLLIPLLLAAGCSSAPPSSDYPNSFEEDLIVFRDGPIDTYFSTNDKDLKEELLPIVTDKIERIIEQNMTELFDRRIDIVEPEFKELGVLIWMAKKGELDVIRAGTYGEEFKVPRWKRKAIEYLGDRLGEELWGRKNLNQDIDDIADLLQIIARDEFDAGAARQELAKYDLPETGEFVTYVSGVGGFAYNYGIKHKIELDNGLLRSFHSLVPVWAHEGNHTLVFSQKNLDNYLLELIPSEDVIPNEETTINETFCDIVGDLVHAKAVDEYVSPDSDLYQTYESDLAWSSAFYSFLSGVAEDFRAMPLEQRLDYREEFFDAVKNHLEDEIGLSNPTVNEARLALNLRYSGEKKVKAQVNFLIKELGVDGLADLNPSLVSFTKLDKAVDYVKKGLKDVQKIERLLNPNITWPTSFSPQ